MADLGAFIKPDVLFLTDRRDFEWTITNRDPKTKAEIPWPAGAYSLELETGGEHNALHRVYVSGATGGTYTLKVNNVDTPAIDYNDVSENPQGLAGDIQDAVNAAVDGNALVHPVSLYPAWTLNFNLNSSKPLTEQLVNTINKAANDFFDAFEQLFGVDVTMVVTDTLNFKLLITSRRSFDEVGIITFAVDVTATAVKNFFNGFAGLIGAVNTVNTDFYWNRTYDIEFVNWLSNQPIPATTINGSSLTGANKRVQVDVIDPGKEKLTVYWFSVAGPDATVKIDSEEADLLPHRTKWQVVHLPNGEPAGGSCVQAGRVYRQPR
ncbi:hypothetical protein SEA_YECEY3_6 [Mycobacterium phage Yecey3]|uniref:LtfC/p132/Gp6 beta-sandwich domain-containing protein n=1 Tax=Mycobacterium phage Yecey3 TaxID=2656617 RepID=A0A649V8X6_9CAUD|nr:minor tail protein [Mycobacterium phage Yecey3]QGJ88760.1 hypothetical protein SEA_YECEY3_6 [Mycobacterium phage Yecey3]